ncbi:peptidyl-prolyl cis-trans isomerase [Evansella sp. AB-rgal1]|uniref:peptidyl-prolyl cis-trans isomerase n=1 Tax=Evansella sp. AB-rgal1 TaxID=3242696 RepID=UPI00359D08AB
MTTTIFTISGNVKHNITIDPGVWIFDDRKVDLDTYFSQEIIDHQELELKNLALAWNKHRKEGANALSNGNDIKMSKKELTSKSFGVPLAPFLNNASPNENVHAIVFKRNSEDDFVCSMEEAKTAILGFSKDGQPLREDGPVQFYYGDGRNQDNPVTNIISIIVK